MYINTHSFTFCNNLQQSATMCDNIISPIMYWYHSCDRTDSSTQQEQEEKKSKNFVTTQLSISYILLNQIPSFEMHSFQHVSQIKIFRYFNLNSIMLTLKGFPNFFESIRIYFGEMIKLFKVY